MVPNAYLIVEQARVQRESLVRDAEQFRLHRLGREGVASFGVRIRCRLGAWLMAVGQRLAADAPSVGHELPPRNVRTAI